MSVILVNDYLYGMLGEEKVLWNYMLDYIPNLIGVDITTIKNNNQYNENLSFEVNVSNYIINNHNNCTLIIQNGTYFSIIPYNSKKIILIQDNLRKMGHNNYIQEENFKNADYVVSNSVEVDNYYYERKCIQIPLGVDNEIFNIITNDKKILREEILLPVDKYNKFGIFVGSFTEIKGWDIMINIINRRTDIFWILVTKHENENFYSDNSIVYKKINQNFLVKLLNCSDFFILPSPSETQCLASIEANLCNIPSIMKNTGYFTNLNEDEIKNIGIISENFSDEDINKIYENNFNPRELIITKFSIKNMIERWIDLINSIN